MLVLLLMRSTKKDIVVYCRLALSKKVIDMDEAEDVLIRRS